MSISSDKLRREMAALPEPVTDKKPPYWEYWRWDLWRRVTGGENPYSFMGWPCVYHTMLQNHWPEVVQHEFKQMPVSWYDSGLYDLPYPFYPQDYFLRDDSMNLVHQAYHLHILEQETSRRIAEMDSIYEFGGGYGALALVAHRLGFRGTYTIKDIPEFCLLQKFFLDSMGVPIAFANGEYIKECDLYIAGYSLSEIPVAERDAWITAFPISTYLFWYSNRFESYDNIAYFQEHVPELLPGYQWKHWRVEHMPPETWYSIGM